MSSSDLSHAPGPAVGSLANVLEDEKILRERIRDNGHVTRWPSAITVGIPSVKAMGLNARLLETVATWWCPYYEVPTSIPIPVCRKEASCLNFLSRGFACSRVSIVYTCDNCMIFLEVAFSEVRRFRKDMGMPEDPAMVQLDGSGIKRLFSHGIRRMKTRSSTSVASLQEVLLLGCAK